MFDLPRPIIHKNIYIGGLGVKKPQPLGERFEAIMSKGEKGVIIFSLGSIAQFQALDNEKKKAVVSMVRRMPKYHFVVKITKGRYFSVVLSYLFQTIPLVPVTLLVCPM